MSDVIDTERPKRVLVVDEQPIFRLGVRTLLTSAHPGWDVTEADSLDEQRSHLARGGVDLLIIASAILGMELKRGQPMRNGINLWVDIVAITQPDDSIGQLGCIEAGAHATVSRSDPAECLIAAIQLLSIQNLSEGRSSAAARLGPDPSPVSLNLTARQFDVLRLLAKRQSNKLIARDLGLSVSTVKVHLNTVFKALGVRNRVEAVVRARPFQEQLLPTDTT